MKAEQTVNVGDEHEPTDSSLCCFFSQVSNTNNKLHTQVGPDPTSAKISLTIKGDALLLANTKAKCLRCSCPFLLTLSFEMTQNWFLKKPLTVNLKSACTVM